MRREVHVRFGEVEAGRLVTIYALLSYSVLYNCV